MTKNEKIAVMIIVAIVVFMVIYDRVRLQSGVVPLLAEEAARLDALGSMVVGESGDYAEPKGVSYLVSNINWSWPLPSMLPSATSNGG